MSDTIEIRDLDASLEDEYSAFMRRNPSFMIYGTLEFRAFLQRVSGGTARYLAAVDRGRVVGGLPMFTARHPHWGDIVNSLPWYGSHGGCLLDATADGGVRARLLKRYAQLIAEFDVRFATMIPSPDESAHIDEYRDALHPQTTDQRISQVSVLPGPTGDIERQLEQMCRQKTRNLIRKALKQGFTFEIRDSNDSWQFLHQTHVENMAAIGGLPKPQAHFHAMREAIPAAWRQLAVTSLNGQMVAAVLLFRFNKTVEYITPVIKHEFRSLQPLSFTIWHAMLDAIRNGYQKWNWGGTWLTQTSLHHFKEGWGAEARNYQYLIHASAKGLSALRDDRDAVTAAFPYYFVYPFSQLAG